MLYHWNRFWCPRDGQINLDYEGYVINPIASFGPSQNPSLVSLEENSKTNCLILLGEPGMGKSTEFNRFFEISKREAEKNNEMVLFVNLKDCPSIFAINQFIFEDPNFKIWINSDNQMTLFLDSFDEGLLTIEHLANYLTTWLEKLPTKRLRIRIACRTSEWPESFTTKLQSIWNENSVHILELVPLRKIDVREAAESEEINADDFLKEIGQREIVSFAVKPVTLNFLFSNYKQTNSFPSNKSELFYSGCINLCKETNESRIDSGFFGNLSPKQRLKVAGRIASTLMLSNRSVIWNEPKNPYGNYDRESEVSIYDLIGKEEFVDGDSFQINENSVFETLSTGLFSSRGAYRMGFSHQTYCEYLAAWYLYNTSTH